VSSQVPRVNVITRQRLLSDDFNNASRLLSKAMLLGELARSTGDEYLLPAGGMGGVIGGFMVECLPGSNSIRVQGGIALVAATPVSATYDPPVIWMQIDGPTTIDLSALIDPGNPRLVTIELEPAEVALVTTPVDVFDPGTGTFSIDPAAARVLGSQPTILTTAGAAAAAPVVAAGTVGRIPIAIVKLVAAQANFTDGFASVLMCRPLLDAPGDKMVPRDYVVGGGVSVGEESGGAIINLTNLYLSNVSVSLAGIEASIAGMIPFATRGRTATATPGAMLAIAQPIYGYAAPPPWAGDYGNVAAREAWQRNPNAIAFASVQNIVGGSGSTFVSLAAETTTSPGLTLRSAIVFWETAGPAGLERGAGNAPLQVIDARGPYSGALTLDATQDPTWGPTQDVTESVYIGAVSSLNVGASFMAQADLGNGHVRSIDKIDQITPLIRRPFFGTLLAAADAALYPGRFPGMLVGDPEVLPTTAQFVDVLYVFNAGAGAGNPRFLLGNELGFGRTDNTVYVGAVGMQADATTVSSLSISNEMTRIVRSAADSVRYTLVLAAGGTSLQVGLSAYTDAIIAAR